MYRTTSHELCDGCIGGAFSHLEPHDGVDYKIKTSGEHCEIQQAEDPRKPW